MSKTCLICLLGLAVGLSAGQELLTNGDFEQDLSVGWTFTDSGYGTHTYDRATDYQPDPDYEAHTYQYDNPGWARLGQTVECPPPCNLRLTFWAKFVQSGGSSSCWPAACFSVCYLDEYDNVLGETRYYYSTYANWTPSPTLSLYRVSDPDWTEYTLETMTELEENLTGVDPEELAKIEVALYSYTYSG
jgi:hypothetical protein